MAEAAIIAEKDARPHLRGIPDVIALMVIFPLALWIWVRTPAPFGSVAAVYSVCLFALFFVSAAYHAVTWSPAVLSWWKRADHSMIYVFIAASYMPAAYCVLDSHQCALVNGVVWGGALIGVLKTFFWENAPRFITILLYLALGWCVVLFWPTMNQRVSVATMLLFLVGGISYSLGAVVYATRRPNPWPRVFGYHEVMHLFIIAGAVLQAFAQRGILFS
jgi:hemolysin III